MMNALHDAMSKGQGREIIGRLLKELTEYTVFHFKAEEDAMTAAKFAGLAAHREQHRALTAKVLELRTKVDAGKTTITLEVMNFLKSWLNDHIRGTDQMYGPALKKQSIH
jgi:hemerythrin-like metal-binding protein